MFNYQYRSTKIVQMIKCLVVDDEPLAREAIKVYIDKMPDLQLVEECGNALEAMNEIRQKEVDLIFLPQILFVHIPAFYALET